MRHYKNTLLALALSVFRRRFSREKTVLTVAAYPAVDQIVKDSLAVWSKNHPDVEVKVVGREYSDHHTAMTTALAASSGLPDIMTIEYGYLGRFANGGGFENLLEAPTAPASTKRKSSPLRGPRPITRNTDRPHCRPISVPERCFTGPTL